MKPSPIKDIQKLKQQLDIFQEIDFENINAELIRINNNLIKKDDDPVIIAFFPLDDENLTVKEKQNGI
jgi:hypothetical protein